VSIDPRFRSLSRIFCISAAIRPAHCLGTAWVIIWISFRHIRAHQANRQTVSAHRETRRGRDTYSQRDTQRHMKGKMHVEWDIKMGADKVYCSGERDTQKEAHTANNFPFMYSQKRFYQASLLISTKYFPNIISCSVWNCYILKRSAELDAAIQLSA